MMVRKAAIFIICNFVLLSLQVNAQIEEDRQTAFKFGLYVDLFYGYDFNRPDSTQRLPAIYQYSRHNEFNLNYGLIGLGVDNPRYRANLSFHAGTYVKDNYALEKGTLQNIHDANISLALDGRARWWIEAGIFGNSWIGMQSTFSYDNSVVAHNLNSEYTPYYFSGLFTSFHPTDRWKISLGIANGWQRITRVEGNSLPSFGLQATYSGEDGVVVNFSSFYGTDDPDSTRRIRNLNNTYVFLPFGPRWMLKAGFDFGFQQQSKGSSSWNNWYGSIVVLNFQIDPKWSTSLRHEFYIDNGEVIVDAPTPVQDFRLSGLSGNIDYQVFEFVKARFEARYLWSPDRVFPRGESTSRTDDNFFLLIVLTSKLEKIL